MTRVFDRLRHVVANPTVATQTEAANRPGIEAFLARYDSGGHVGLVDSLGPNDHRP
jgi:hypothetical protein